MDKITDRYIAMAHLDNYISKASGVAPLVTMSRIEQRLHQYLSVTWYDTVASAIKQAKSEIKDGVDGKKIKKAVDGEMKKWNNKVKSIYLAELRNVYRLGRTAAWKVLTGQADYDLTYFGPKMEVVKKAKKKKPKLNPTFNLKDKKAVEALNEHQLYWMGEFYEEAVSDQVAKTAKETVVESGGSYKLAGDYLDERMNDTLSHVVMPSGYVGTVDSYLRGVVANAVTTSRVVGQMNSFVEVGVENYRINAIGDSRTCERCSHMDGKVFTVKQGVDQMEKVLSAKTPDDVKSIHPWLSYQEMLKLSPKPGNQTSKDSSKLVSAGFNLPPFHFKCRCTVDVSYDSYEYKP